MVSPVLEKELHRQLEHLPVGEQKRVLDFARALAASHPQGVPGKTLLQFSGTISLEDLQLMSQAIEEGCEKIDSNEW